MPDQSDQLQPSQPLLEAPDEQQAALPPFSESTQPGVVTSVTVPLVTIEGLPHVFTGEVLRFDQDRIGQVLSFEDGVTQCMLLSTKAPALGSLVYQTHQPITITVGKHMLGRAYDSLGRSLSKLKSEQRVSATAEQRVIDIQPPPLPNRARIDRQLETGTMIVDSVLPIGHGQRELIAGDAKTGKTSFLLSAARQQAKAGTIIVYCLIGKKSADLQKVLHFFHSHRMQDDVVVVASTPSDSASLITLTPFTAMTIAEYFRDQGQDTLVILDDLSSHARFYREVALLEKRFPGRDSYPGDIFYTHARILERAGCYLVPDNSVPRDPERPDEPVPAKKVAITCLPVAETTNGDLTDFIVSNLISITDGHLLFDARRFAAGLLPAIDMTLSVTRVGKQTQSPLGRSLTQALIRFLNRYYKAAQLTHFGSELSNQSREYLERGKVIERLLTQSTKQLFSLEVQQLSLALAWQGWLRNVSVEEHEDYRAKLGLIFRHEPLKSRFLEVLTKSQTFDELLDNILPHEQALLEFFEKEHQKLLQQEAEEEARRQAKQHEEALKKQQEEQAKIDEKNKPPQPHPIPPGVHQLPTAAPLPPSGTLIEVSQPPEPRSAATSKTPAGKPQDSKPVETPLADSKPEDSKSEAPSQQPQPDMKPESETKPNPEAKANVDAKPEPQPIKSELLADPEEKDAP